MTIQQVKDKMKQHSIKNKAMFEALGINEGDWYNYLKEKKPFPASRGIAAKYFFESLEK